MKKQDFKDSKDAILKAANDENFYGKRKRDSKLEAAENVIDFLKLGCEAFELVDWLENNRPVKAAKAKAHSNKPAPNTMLGNETRQRDNLEVIKGDTFIVTAAQNNTEVSSVFPQLLDAAKELNAQLIVLPMYYNKKAFSATAEDDSEYFADAVKPYLIEHDSWLGDENIVKIAAQAAIPLTTKQPINAAQNLNNGELCTIVGHPKVQQRTLLKMAGEEIKTAWSTGSCTKYNYIRGRAGSEAENMHGFGATLVQIIDGKPFCTNLVQAADGSLVFFDYCNDLFYFGIDINEYRAPVVTVGDSHFEQFDERCFEDVKTLLTVTRAKLAVLHDIAHSESRSHHNVNTSSHWYKNKGVSIESELAFIINRVNEYAEICDVFLVESNHNSVLDGWLNSPSTANNITFDTINSKLYHLLKYLVCEAIDEGDDYRALMLSFENAELTKLPKLADNVRWGHAHIPEVHYNTGFETHGHKGANGAAKGLTTGKINQSMCLGHTHSPEISYMTARGGIATQGTTAKMDQGYNRGGGSSWGQASLITHCNGITQQRFHFLD